jgi:Holliday junction resolvase
MDSEMKNEQQFNTWLRRMFREARTKAIIQRIENTTSNGVPDILAILPNQILLIESKFQTRKLRPEQASFQIKTNETIRGSVNKCLTLSAYPKTKRFVVLEFDSLSITEEGIVTENQWSFSLDKEGFNQFLNIL